VFFVCTAGTVHRGARTLPENHEIRKNRKNSKNGQNSKNVQNSKNGHDSKNKQISKNISKSPIPPKIQAIIETHNEFLKSQKSIINLDSDSGSNSSQTNTPKPPSQFAIKTNETHESPGITKSSQKIKPQTTPLSQKFKLPKTPETKPLFKRKQLVPQTPELLKLNSEQKQVSLNKSINQSSFTTGFKKSLPPRISDTPRVGKKVVQPDFQKKSLERLGFQDGTDSKLKPTFSTVMANSGSRIEVNVAGFDDKSTKSSATFV